MGKSTFAQIIVWIFFIVTGFFVFYFFMKKVYSRLYVPVFLLENADFGQIVESFAIFMSMIIFINAFLGDWLDVVFHKTQNDLYRSHKNAVNNHILWSFIFFAAYLYNH